MKEAKKTSQPNAMQDAGLGPEPEERCRWGKGQVSREVHSSVMSICISINFLLLITVLWLYKMLTLGGNGGEYTRLLRALFATFLET